MTSKSKIEFASNKHKMSFWDTLDESILDSDYRHDKDVAFYPSEARLVCKDEYSDTIVLGGCQRKSWFRNKLQRVERDKEHQTELFDAIDSIEHSASDLWKFKLSSGVESDIHAEARRANIYYDNSHKFEWDVSTKDLSDHYLVRGEIDLIVLEKPESDVKVGIEVKSITGYYGQRKVFGKRSSKGHWISKPEPKEDNLLQAVLYAYLFCIVKKELSYFKLVYISRENGERNEFDIDLIPEDVNGVTRHRVYVDRAPYKYKIYAEDLTDSYEELHEAIVKDLLPTRDFQLQYSDSHIQKLYNRGELSKTDTAAFESKKTITKGDWQCSYCKFKDMCYDGSQPIEYDNNYFTNSEMLSKLTFSTYDVNDLF